MQFTPSQVAMCKLLGKYLPFIRHNSLEEKIRAGHQDLVRMTGQDFGFDPLSWHQYLCKTDDGGYKWSNNHKQFPRVIKFTLEDERWQNAVKNLTATPTDSKE